MSGRKRTDKHYTQFQYNIYDIQLYVVPVPFLLSRRSCHPGALVLSSRNFTNKVVFPIFDTPTNISFMFGYGLQLEYYENKQSHNAPTLKSPLRKIQFSVNALFPLFQ